MSDKTGIEWTDATWNPTTGCDRVSPGCDHCYAMTLAPRLKAMGSPRYQRDGDPKTSGPGFGVSMHQDALDQPLRWQKPRRIFVNSMSDLFHDEITDDFIARVFDVMARLPQHTFQLLTKRHGRMRSLLRAEAFISAVRELHMAAQPVPTPVPIWPLANVWLGVSVENQQWADIRIPALLGTPAAVRFLSCEPLLGPVDLRRHLDPERDCNCNVPAMEGAGQHASRCRCLTQPDIDWVIVGGESGHGARPMHPDWARSLRDQCQAARIPFLFKQWGDYAPSVGRVARQDFVWADGEHTRRPATMSRIGPARKAYVADSVPARDGWVNVERVGKGMAGRVLDGRTWDEFPEAVTSR